VNHQSQISFFIIVSSSNLYAEHLGGDATFSGVVIGIPTVFAGLILLPMAKYDGGHYMKPLHFVCATSILGHIFYAVAYRANWLYLILLGRIVSGFSFTGFMYTKRFCTDPLFVGTRRRTTLASYLVMGQGIGMSAGPFLGGLLYKVGFPSSTFNGFTA
jgi:Zn-dependent protease